jgi:hypothetical protein
MTDTIETDIKKYELYELMGLFGVPYELKDNHMKQIHDKTQSVSESLGLEHQELARFYKKAERTMDVIHHFRKIASFLNSQFYPQAEEEKKWIEKVYEIPGFEQMALDDLVKLVRNYVELQPTQLLGKGPFPQTIIDSTQNNIYNPVETWHNISPELGAIELQKLKCPDYCQEVVKVVSIDSLFRDNFSSSSSTDFTITLPMRINGVRRMEVISAEFATAFYTFDSKTGNNDFALCIEDLSNGIGPIDYPIKIPDGIWYSNDFQLLIQEYFDSSGTSLLPYIKISISTINGKTTFSFRSPSEIAEINTALGYSLDPNLPTLLRYKLKNTKAENSDKEPCIPMYYFYSATYTMGFMQDQLDVWVTYNNLLTALQFTINGYLESNYIYGSSLEHYVFLVIDDYVIPEKNQMISVCPPEGYLGENIIARIQVKNPKFENHLDNAGDHVFKQRNYSGPVNISKLRVRLVDKYGKVIHLNNEISFCLKFIQ